MLVKSVTVHLTKWENFYRVEIEKILPQTSVEFGGLEIIKKLKTGNTRKISSFRVFPIKQTTRVIEDDWKKVIQSYT